jgi:oxidation protein CepF
MQKSSIMSGLIASQRDRFDRIDQLNQLRVEAPVTRVEIPTIDSRNGAKKKWAWLVTRYDDVRYILSQPDLFSSKPNIPGQDFPGGLKRVPTSLIAMDPPDHTRLRPMLAPLFTAKRLTRLQPVIEAVMAECLDLMENAGPPADLVREFAEPVSLRVVCELLGLSRDDGIELRNMRSGVVAAPSNGGNRVVGGMHRHWQGLSNVIARQRRQPDDSLLGSLVRRHGDELTDEDLYDIAGFMLSPGYHNTIGMLGLGTLLLLENPEQLILALDNPAGIENMVEEMLRYLSILSAPQARTALSDVIIAGQQIKAGELVLCSLSSANRDDVLGPEMDRLDVSRCPVAHVAFGYGIHYCLGAPLTRMVMRVAYVTLFQRFPGLRLAVRFEDLSFHPVPSHNVESLPVSW